jgi:hypothetical protein
MTFEREFMAAACLAVVWINTGLIVSHAYGDLLGLSRLRRRLSGTVGLFNADSAEGGPSYRLLQAGRTRGDGAIHFHDRQVECSLIGRGHAETARGRFEVAVQEGGAWVWPTQQQVAEATRCTSVEDFDTLAQRALHARGAERAAVVRLGGRIVIAGGSVRGSVLCGDRSEPLLFSSDDPRSRLLGMQLRVAWVVAAMLTIAGLLTWLCFIGPAFGGLSQLGALGLFLYFLLVQPVGVWLSESVRFPHEAYRGGSWRRRRLPGEAAYLERSAASN